MQSLMHSSKDMNISDIKRLLKPGFVEKYKSLLGYDYNIFLATVSQWMRKSIRVNTLKASVEQVVNSMTKEWILEPIPWCKQGFFIKHKTNERFDVGNTFEHQLGYIYVQEAASMIPALVLDLEQNSNQIIIDCCAAPGSKTTQIAALMKNNGLIIANDSDVKRLKALTTNIQRSGVANTIITNNDARAFSKLENFFDRILLDVPCSGTGTISKSLKTLKIWNPNMIRKLSMQQKSLIANCFKALKPKGIMVYSTCSLEPEENEIVIDWFLKNFENAKLKPIKLPLKSSKPILEYQGLTLNKQIKNCLRLWPQDNNTSGFFVAKIVKEDQNS